MSDIIRQFQLATIQERFWIDDFKQGQEDAINHILDGSDTLIKMPTWWGKSLCYQWPAAITRNKVMIVTSPLISLMGDQLQSLSHHGVSATTINWNTSDSDRMDKMRRMREWEYRMLYVAPETLVKKRFLSEAWRVDFDRIVSDEAQCISKWWNWFRPDYLAIWQAARRLCIEQKIACSATIDWEVEEDIIRYLRMDSKTMQTVSVPWFRPNLDFSVEKFSTKTQESARKHKMKRVKAFLMEERYEPLLLTVEQFLKPKSCIII